jgi:hypothetical protein
MKIKNEDLLNAILLMTSISFFVMAFLEMLRYANDDKEKNDAV